MVLRALRVTIFSASAAAALVTTAWAIAGRTAGPGVPVPATSEARGILHLAQDDRGSNSIVLPRSRADDERIWTEPAPPKKVVKKSIPKKKRRTRRAVPRGSH